MKNTPMPDRMRPRSFDDMVGQAHLFGPGGTLRRMVERGHIGNMIFYGPPGTGKTTAAEIVAERSGMTFHRLNATTASLSDVKQVLEQTDTLFGAGGILLYLDEIQYFNRKQQQSLLDYIEDGRVTLIASTTENPHFYVYSAILSRSSLFEFKPVQGREMVPRLRTVLDTLNADAGSAKTASDELLTRVGTCAGGDVRHAIVLLENAFVMAEDELREEHLTPFVGNVHAFGDDTHYDLLSALQKSIRGSDPDAAVCYLAALLNAGELLSVCRRLQVIASEDVGLAYPMAAVVTRACCESAKELGMPEAQIPLANAAILLATAPKSNSACAAVETAMVDAEAGRGADIPTILQSPLYAGYRYPHDYPNHYVAQQYLPDSLRNRRYYTFGSNRTEQAAAAYARQIRGKEPDAGPAEKSDNGG